MKKLDKLIIRAFIPPFIFTFFIALFVLNMQFLWKYIDDIVGKGLDLSVIFELLFYQSLAVVPLAMLLGVLIASVMVMGGLGEHYELASIKSAGVSLLRIMLPLIGVCSLVCMSSFVFSNSIIPVASLKFKSKLYDIRKQKPALSLDKGAFNYDFQNFVIHIRDKDDNTNLLDDIKIYDHTKNRGNVSQVNADQGEMYYSEDKRFLILKLKEGYRYEEMEPSVERRNAYPHMRMAFSEYTSMFDLSQFDLNKTDEELFKSHYSMLTISQLKSAIDSIRMRRNKRVSQLKTNARPYFHYLKTSMDSIQHVVPDTFNYPMPDTMIIPKQFVEQFSAARRGRFYEKAIRSMSNMENFSQHITEDMRQYQVSHVEHENEVHRKFSLAIACMIFLFIGAPMGAIVRKGGFGWPILISIIFFMIFFVLNLSGEKLAKNLSLPSWLGMWLPCLVLTPIGLFLTIKAMNDSKLLNTEAYVKFFSRLNVFKSKSV